MATSYYNRDGDPIGKEEWMKLRKDQKYFLVRNFEDEKVRLMVEWLGEVRNAERVWATMRQLFVVHVYNRDEHGNFVKDPISHSKTFAVESEAITCYDEFLLRWTECERDSAGKLAEVGNVAKDLTPPEPEAPPPPDKPTSSLEGVGLNDDAGVW